MVVRREKDMGGLRLIKNFFKNFFNETKCILFYGIISFVVIIWCPAFINLLLSFVMFIIFLNKQMGEKPEVDLRSLVRSLVSGSIPGYSTFMIIILFIVYTSWFADFLLKGDFFKAIASFFFTVGIIPLYALSLKYNFGTQTDRVPKKILVSALSKPKGKANLEDLKKAYKSGENALIMLNQTSWHNWIPILRLHLFHKDTLHKWFILVSNESKDYINNLKEITEEEKIEALEADFNNYDSISSKLLYILREIKKKGYSDNDISVYISGGTSAVTLALTLFAVKDGRQVEYVRQDSMDITAINISFEDLHSFSPEGR